MLWKGNQLLQFTFNAKNGYIGRCADIYFDESDWTVRYFVSEMAGAQENTRVLLSPDSFCKIDQKKKSIWILEDLETISNSPEFDQDLPITRQYEIALRRYYEWPLYWENTSFMDVPPISGYKEPDLPLDELGRPIMDGTDMPVSDEIVSDTSEAQTPQEPEDDEIMEAEFGETEQTINYNPELRSLLSIEGYRIQTTDEDSSTVEDLIIDETDWHTSYLLVNLHEKYENRRVLLTLHWVRDINMSNSIIFCDLSQQQLKSAPAFNPDQQIDIEYEKKVYEYYDSL